MATTSKKASNFLTKVGATIKDTYNEYTKNFVKAEEGFIDTIAGTAAWATKNILPGVSSSLQSFVERDLTNELYTRDKETTLDKVLDVAEHVPNLMPFVKGVQALTGNYQLRQTYDQEDSKLDAVNVPLSKVTNGYLNDITMREVVGQIGNMTPTIMLGGAAKAAGWGNAGIKAASVGSLGVSAAGGSMQDALNDGANIGQAVTYGYAKGAVEAGTELLGDSMGVMFGGGGGLLDRIIPATTIGAKLVRGFGEEAVEEAISSAVDPFVKQIYDKNSIRDTFTTGEGLKGYTSDIINSAIMGGVTSLAMAPLGSGNIVEDVETSKTLTQRQKSLEASGKLTTEKATKLNEQIAKANANVETKLKKMSETDRAKTIQALKLTNYESDGTLKKTYEKAKYATIGTETHDVQQMAKDAGFTLSESLTSEQESNLQKVKKNLYKLQAKGLNTDGIVVVKENQNNNGTTLAGANNGKVIFVNENRLTELNSALQTLAHESAHSLPGTFATMSLLDAVMNDETNGKAVRDVLDNYDVTEEEWNAAKDAFEKGTATEKQFKIVDETNAAFSENVLGNEEAMRVLTRNNEGLVIKAYNSLCDAIKLKQLTGAAKSEYKTMLEYAAAFEDAMTSEGIDFVPMSGDDKDEAKYSVKANDAEYTELAKDPESNKARLQEMVDAAAKNDGYTVKAYHGSEYEGRITSFKGDTDGVTYATDSRDVAKTYSAEGTENIYNVYIDTNGFLTVDTEGGYNRSVKIPDELKDIWYSSRNRTQTNDIVYLAKQKGYKGVIFKNINDVGMHNWEWDENNVAHYPGASTVYAVIGSNNIKSADTVTYDDNGNVIPLSERFNTQNDDIRYSVKKKAYTYDEMKAVVDKVTDGLKSNQYDVVVPKYVRKRAASLLSDTVNSTKENRAGIVADIADEIIEKSTVWDNEALDAQNDYVKSGQYEDDMNALAILKSHFKTIKTGKIRGEIKAKYDDRAKGVLSRWSSNIATENPLTADQVLAGYWNELKLPDVDSDSHPADILIAMNERYEELKAKTEKVKPTAMTFDSAEARNRFKNDIVTYMLNEVDALGDRSVNVEEQYSEAVAKHLAKKETAAKIEKAEERAAYAQEELANIKNRLTELSSKAQGTANLIHKIAQTADELHAMTDRKYAQTHNIPVAANLYTDEEFRGVVKASEKLFRDGLIDPKKVRTQLNEVAKLLSQKEVFDKYVNDVTGSEENAAFIGTLLENTMETFADHFDDTTNEFNNDVLSYAELKNASDLLSFVKHIYTHYDTVFRNGKAHSAEKLSVAEQEILSKSAQVNVKKNKSNLFKEYKKWFTTPISVFEHVELYDEDGELTRLSRELRKQTWVKQDEYLNLTEKLDEFGKKNKHFLKKIRNERVTVEGQSMLLTEFINMRAQFTQENGRLTIENGGGIIFHDENGNKSNPTNFTKEGIEAAWSKLGPEVQEYYDLIYEIANEGGKLKAATDMQLYGYTDVKGDGKYFQLRRERRYFKSYAGDASKMSSDAQSVFNSAINKKRSKNAMKIPLAAQDSFANITEYVNQVTNYYAYAVTLSDFRKIYNKQTETGKSMRFMLEEAWDGDTNEMGGDKYLSKYLNDIQGIKTGESFAWLGKLRGAYAQAQLGMNIKVIGGQFCSFPTAFAYLNIADMEKGLLMQTDYGKMMQYSVLARTRFDSNTAFKSETLTDNINAIGAVGSVGISWADKMTIGKIWNACVAHCEIKYAGPDLYVKAAELFDEVVTNTQPTYQASDRSQFQRSNNELVKSFAMFTSVPMKQISELLSSVDRVHTYNAMNKAGYKVSDNVQNEAVHKMCKTAAGVVVANAVYAAMCQLVKHLFDKDEEEDNNGRKWYEQMGMQFLETNASMFPVMKEVYGYFVNGYDLDVNVVGSMNDLLSSVKSLVTADSSEEFAKGLKNVSFYGCMMLGVPARNTYNLVYGLTKRFSKPTAMKIDSWFTTKKSYGSALNSAVEKGDAKMIDTILQIQSGVDGLPSVYNSLIQNGYVDILPKSVGTSFTYDGETYEMTKAEQAQFREVYTGYAKAVSDMTKTVVFKTATDDVKAKAIKAIQNTYWQMAIDKTVGDETTAKLYVFSKAISIGKLAVITEVCKAYSADKDDDGNSIAGSKKAKVLRYLAQTDLTKAQQALVLAYLGYTDSSSRQTVRAYINSLAITKKEKELLFSMCGY